MANKRKLLILGDYKESLRDMDRFRKDLSYRLRPMIFTFNSMEEFHYEALKHIKPFNRTVTNNSQSIERGITKLVHHFFGNRREVRVHRLTDNGGRVLAPTKKDHDPIKTFQEWVLGFSKPPKHSLNILKPKVELHLKKINDLVKHYEELPEVQGFLMDRKVRPSHQTKTILDFYIRCLQERQKILDYYLEGVYERAINKSRAYVFSFLALNLFDTWKDYPYELGRYPYGRSLDYRNIDCFSHRVGEVPIRFIREYERLYVNNKELFYKKLFKLRSVAAVFDNIFTHLKDVPLTRDRAAIFTELKSLFEKKKWLAFYALALPQVEGLFAEMVVSSNPKSGAISKSLPDKVRSVRPDYELSSAYFDYYEYELPNQRNSFSHTGFSENDKLKAYDILIDLEHVLSVFASLENPLVNITKIIRKKDPSRFSDLKSYAKYFNLVDNLPPDYKSNQTLQADINAFNKDFLGKECSIEKIIQNAEAIIDFGFSDLWSNCKAEISEFESADDWNSLNKQKIKKLLKEDGFREKADSFFRLNEDEINIAFSLGVFFSGVKKHLYSDVIPEELSQSFDTWENNKSFVKWLKDFKGQLPTEEG